MMAMIQCRKLSGTTPIPNRITGGVDEFFRGPRVMMEAAEKTVAGRVPGPLNKEPWAGKTVIGGP
jgi:hypothetical protein